MGTGNKGLYSNTRGSKPTFRGTPLFSSTGHISEKSISANREYFYNKSATDISHDLEKHGYETTVRNSTHSTSRAKIIVVGNSDKHKNITQVQVSPGSSRHGNVPYVKISTNNGGRYKVIDGTKDQYKTDGKEKSTLFFRRNHT